MQGRALRELTACPGAHDTAGPGKLHPERPNQGSEEEEASDSGLGTCRAETAARPPLESGFDSEIREEADSAARGGRRGTGKQALGRGPLVTRRSVREEAARSGCKRKGRRASASSALERAAVRGVSDVFLLCDHPKATAGQIESSGDGCFVSQDTTRAQKSWA